MFAPGPRYKAYLAANNVTAEISRVYTQALPATVWFVTHNLGRFPSVTVVTTSGDEADGDVRYVDANNLTITFFSAFAGTAYLN